MSDSKHIRAGNVKMQPGENGEISIKSKGWREYGQKRASKENQGI